MPTGVSSRSRCSPRNRKLVRNFSYRKPGHSPSERRMWTNLPGCWMGNSLSARSLYRDGAVEPDFGLGSGGDLKVRIELAWPPCCAPVGAGVSIRTRNSLPLRRKSESGASKSVFRSSTRPWDTAPITFSRSRIAGRFVIRSLTSISVGVFLSLRTLQYKTARKNAAELEAWASGSVFDCTIYQDHW